ncbi:MAG TPA: hypothetical protein VFH31_01970 [Pyrinomonadaceae bacterium]|nr:hypothetical protein [Pyrinomonadaceae bacterium]
MLQQTRTTHWILLAILMAASIALSTQTAVAQQYQVSYLDSIGGTRSRGNSINNRGWIAGFSFVSADLRRHATLWREGSVLDLGTLGHPDRNSNVAWPVKNNRGIIAGISQTDTPEPNGETWSCAAFFGGQSGFICLGFVWQDGVMTRLLPLAGWEQQLCDGRQQPGKRRRLGRKWRSRYDLRRHSGTPVSARHLGSGLESAPGASTNFRRLKRSSYSNQ